MKRLLCALLLLFSCQVAHAADTDGDGLLDLIDVPGFDPNSPIIHPSLPGPSFFFDNSRIQDLDGASLLTKGVLVTFFNNQVASIENGDFAGLTNMKELGLSVNRISTVDPGDFTGLSNLQRLHLGGNRITSIGTGGFQELGKLEQLFLLENRLTGVESGDFQGLVNLKELYLFYNQISGIESGDFQQLAKLERLKLDHNRIASIESGGFQGLGNLTSLDLFANQLSSVESGDFQGLGKLKVLFLFDNQLSGIESGDFQGLNSLEELYVYDNQITSIESAAFQGFANLRRLNLSDNQIAAIEAGTFRGQTKLNSLSLFDNDLTELNFTDADFAGLTACEFRDGFCIDREEVVSLVLDDAAVSKSSFAVIVGETVALQDVSLVGLQFSDGNPTSLAALLGIPSLDNVAVDPDLFNLYGGELTAFDALPGNTVTVVAPLAGDTNGDRVVDLADLNNVRNRFGEGRLGGPSTALEAYPFDGAVDLNDLNRVRNFFGTGAEAVAAPEPSGVSLAGVATGLLLGGAVRRRVTRPQH